MSRVEDKKDHVSFAAQLDATYTVALGSIDAATCVAAVVGIAEEFGSSVRSVAALKEAGVPKITACARGESQARILRVLGASGVIEVESEVGRGLANALSSEIPWS